jgi:hypothetical protein
VGVAGGVNNNALKSLFWGLDYCTFDRSLGVFLTDDDGKIEKEKQGQ